MRLGPADHTSPAASTRAVTARSLRSLHTHRTPLRAQDEAQEVRAADDGSDDADPYLERRRNGAANQVADDEEQPASQRRGEDQPPMIGTNQPRRSRRPNRRRAPRRSRRPDPAGRYLLPHHPARRGPQSASRLRHPTAGGPGAGGMPEPGPTGEGTEDPSGRHSCAHRTPGGEAATFSAARAAALAARPTFDRRPLRYRVLPRTAIGISVVILAFALWDRRCPAWCCTPTTSTASPRTRTRSAH